MTEKQKLTVAKIAGDLYEKFTDIIPEGTNLLSVIRAAESLISHCITEEKDESKDDECIDTICEEIKKFTKLLRAMS